MKVKCINIYNEHTKQCENESYRLNINNIYIVLEIFCSSKKNLSYRLVGDNLDSSPAIFEAKQFELISTKIPYNWKITVKKNGLIILGPEAWRKEGFWERCYDQDPAALEIYKREARIIYEEEGFFQNND